MSNSNGILSNRKSPAETCTPEMTVALSGIFGEEGEVELSIENPVQHAPIQQKNPFHCLISFKYNSLTGNKHAKPKVGGTKI